MNVEKSKTMVFKKGGGKEQNTNWKWEGKAIKEVKEMLYFGIKMQMNGELTNNIRERMKRANVVMKQVPGIGERKFQNGFKRRMMLFDYLVVGVMLEELMLVELFGWKEIIECERIQQKYIRWCLGLERCTPGCMIL